MGFGSGFGSGFWARFLGGRVAWKQKKQKVAIFDNGFVWVWDEGSVLGFGLVSWLRRPGKGRGGARGRGDGGGAGSGAGRGRGQRGGDGSAGGMRRSL